MSVIHVHPTPCPPAASPEAATRGPLRRFVGVVRRPQTYRNLAYLLLGLPLGTIWFAVLVTGWSVGLSLLVVALLGIPVLLGVWYLTRWSANAERAVANTLLGQYLAHVPMASPAGNVWVRLRSMTADRARWREVGYLLARFPAGIATFTIAVTALATPGLVAYAPFAARREDEPFGNWAFSTAMEDVASSPWAWFLVPLGIALVIPALHLVNAVAAVCARWNRSSLDQP